MNCEMCGKETGLNRAIIEGVKMNVCPKCAKFGRIVENARAVDAKKEAKKDDGEDVPEIVEGIADDYAQIVKQAREKTGLKQEDVAKRINEKESIIHQVESGHFKPGIALARKLERFFRIKLVEEITVEKEKKPSKTESEGLTIGDLIKKK